MLPFFIISLTSTSLMTDSAGNQIGTTVKYLPFGETRMGSVPTDKLFTGKRLDSTGLYYYGARYYDPGIGGFISPDTASPDLSIPQSFNKYAYCFNNPLKYNDPTGNWPSWSNIWGGVKSAVQATVSFVQNNIDAIQTGLDVLGMIPVVGEAFDAVNGVIYAARGDVVNAGLSFASCIPVAGNVIGGAKLVAKAVNTGIDIAKGFDTARDVKKAWTAINGPLEKGMELHHIVEKCQIGKSGFDPRLVHNLDNMIAIDNATHVKITKHYNSIYDFTGGQRVRNYLKGQDTNIQLQYGKDILKNLGY
jgi:RHS repeat-associated protein